MLQSFSLSTEYVKLSEMHTYCIIKLTMLINKYNTTKVYKKALNMPISVGC